MLLRKEDGSEAPPTAYHDVKSIVSKTPPAPPLPPPASASLMLLHRIIKPIRLLNEGEAINTWQQS